MLMQLVSVNKIYAKVMEYSEKNETENMYYAFGRIFRMVVDFEPVIIENAPMN